MRSVPISHSITGPLARSIGLGCTGAEREKALTNAGGLSGPPLGVHYRREAGMDSRSGRKARHGEPMTGTRKCAKSPFAHVNQNRGDGDRLLCRDAAPCDLSVTSIDWYM